jgi:predicted component of type VI protein secretion system
VPLGANAVLGRTPSPVDEHDVLLPVRDDEGTVSKNHLRIEHGRDGVWLTDLGSTNGTRLVDEDGTTRIPTGVRTALDDGVRVRIGRRAFTVSVVVREV